MNKRILALALAAVVTSSLLAACSIKKDPPAATEGTDTPIPSDPPGTVTASPAPSENPTEKPTVKPTEKPTARPTEVPTEKPTPSPTEIPQKEDNIGMTFLQFPASCETFSMDFAKTVLPLNNGSDAAGFAASFRQYGFTVLTQGNFDKPDTDKSHTSAFTLGAAKGFVNGEQRVILALSVRGTNGGEWYSNLDFAPSRDNNTLYAENFLMAAEDILHRVRGYFDLYDNPVILITGYSRGAACANLLGLKINGEFGKKDVYVYSFATPTTVRFDAEGCENIFNIINPADAVPKMPMAFLGYRRCGTDVFLDGDKDYAAQVEAALNTLAPLAPDVESFYSVRHSLTGPGVDEADGMTAHEAMQLVAGVLSGSTNGFSPLSLIRLARIITCDPSSDLYPLAQLLIRLFSLNSAGITRVLNQHLPTSYLPLMGFSTEEIMQYLMG